MIQFLHLHAAGHEHAERSLKPQRPLRTDYEPRQGRLAQSGHGLLKYDQVPCRNLAAISVLLIMKQFSQTNGRAKTAALPIRRSSLSLCFRFRRNLYTR